MRFQKVIVQKKCERTPNNKEFGIVGTKNCDSTNAYEFGACPGTDS